MNITIADKVIVTLDSPNPKLESILSKQGFTGIFPQFTAPLSAETWVVNRLAPKLGVPVERVTAAPDSTELAELKEEVAALKKLLLRLNNASDELKKELEALEGSPNSGN